MTGPLLVGLVLLVGAVALGVVLWRLWRRARALLRELGALADAVAEPRPGVR